LKVYADTSFLVSLYIIQETGSPRANAYMRRSSTPLPFTLLHRLELRNAIYLAAFRKEITSHQRKAAIEQTEMDLKDGILLHIPVTWIDIFREAEKMGETFTETHGFRSLDLLHVAGAKKMGATKFLSFDKQQCRLAEKSGLDIRI